MSWLQACHGATSLSTSMATHLILSTLCFMYSQHFVRICPSTTTTASACLSPPFRMKFEGFARVYDNEGRHRGNWMPTRYENHASCCHTNHQDKNNRNCARRVPWGTPHLLPLRVTSLARLKVAASRLTRSRHIVGW
jgi:hypothetical protein